jgi:hypothetical protein
MRRATSQKGIVMNTKARSTSKVNFVYEADHIDRVLYVDVDSMKLAGQITNPEFTEFQKVTAMLPGYELQLKEFPKKNKRTYGGLTIKVMQAFIIQYEESPEKVAESLKELNKKKAEGLLKGATYGVVKSWFLDKYSKVFNSSALYKKDGKRDALIKELLATVDNSIINPPIATKQEGVVSNG